MKRTVRPALVGFLSFTIVVSIAASPGAVFSIDQGSDESVTPHLSEPAYTQRHSVGFFESLFDFKRRASSPEQDRIAGAKSPRSGAASDERSLQPNGSLTSGIQRGTPPKRAVALRLAERGRQYLLQKQHQKAVSYLEKALGLEASPYVYYYLSRAHYDLGHYAESANFLDVAASLLAARPEWVTAVAAMRAQYTERPRSDDKEHPVARVKAVRPSRAPDRSGM